MIQSTTIGSGQDVIAFLKGQHERIKALFQNVIASTGEARKSAFIELRRMLAVHETAEEEIVHPTARRALPNGEAVIAARLNEEHDAKKVLTDLESLDVQSPEFEAKFRTLQTAVLAHAQAEEREEFDKLATKLDDARLQRMRKAVEFAEKVAPTHPHAGVETMTANLLAGPFAAMMDRARDAISKN